MFCLETCVLPLKVDKICSSVSRKKIDEVKQEQPDSSNIIASSEDSKKMSIDISSSDVIDSNEAEAK